MSTKRKKRTRSKEPRPRLPLSAIKIEQCAEHFATRMIAGRSIQPSHVIEYGDAVSRKWGILHDEARTIIDRAERMAEEIRNSRPKLQFTCGRWARELLGRHSPR